MLSESQRGMAEISAENFFDLKHWQKIQNLFAEIIGANLWPVNIQGTPLAAPSKICTYCSDLHSSSYTSTRLTECALKAFQAASQQNETLYQCQHLATYFMVPVKFRTETPAFIIGGPLLLGKRETKKRYQHLCRKLQVDSETFFDWITELRIYSHHGINLIINFLKELNHLFLSEKNEQLHSAHSHPEPSGSSLEQYAYFLANSLLELASQMVGADSGSVLLVDPSKKSFFIQSSRGLNQKILKKKILPLKESVAGWVFSNKKAILIGPQSELQVPQSILKRPYIKSSMILPLQFQDRVYGVFCLNSKTENDRFNEGSLSFLNRLGNLASAALARSVLN